MAIAKLLPVGTVLTTWAVWRVDRRGFGRLVRDLALLYATTAVVFAGVALLVPSGVLRLFVAGGAALVVLAWSWRRWGRELGAFFGRPDPA